MTNTSHDQETIQEISIWVKKERKSVVPKMLICSFKMLNKSISLLLWRTLQGQSGNLNKDFQGVREQLLRFRHSLSP